MVHDEPAIRFEFDLSGAAASQLFTDMNPMNDREDLAAEHPGYEDRMDALRDYIEARSQDHVIVHLDDSGNLTDAEITVIVDVEAHPNCEPLVYGAGTIHMVLDELDTPQNIQAPPPEEVTDAEDFFGESDFGETETATPGNEEDRALSDPFDRYVMESKLSGCPS